MSDDEQFDYFDYDNQPARAPKGYAGRGATEILTPKGTWKAASRTSVTKVGIETAKELATYWVDKGAKLPEDLA